jgi:catechol 2,3-dioxygenase
LGFPLPGQGDHLVSEALYLEDPDGNGIEVYRDRPRDEWPRVNGQIQMASDPVDIRGLLADAAASGEPWNGMPAGTRIGHMHLQVADIPKSEEFYHGVLGFDVIFRMPSALFISAGGYHHHIGMNTWHSRGAGPAPEGTAGLRYFTITLPDDNAIAPILARLDAAGVSYRHQDGCVYVDDPWRNHIRLVTTSN